MSETVSDAITAAYRDGLVPLIDAGRDAGLTYRQIDYWRTHGWIEAELRHRGDGALISDQMVITGNLVGTGYTAFIHESEIPHLRIMAALVRRGMNPRVAKDLADDVRQGPVDFGEGLRLTWTP